MKRPARASRHGDLARALVAAALGVGVAFVVSACSGSSAKLIPVANSEPLQSDFEAVAAAAASGSGNCSHTEEALLKTDEDFNKLPTSVDQGLRSRLREGIEKLHEDALAECAKQASTATTSTTKTSTTKSTPTTQTNTTTTNTNTNAETQTTTGETNTPTTPPTTTPGGGTQVPENEGAGANGGTGVGEEAEGNGANGGGAAPGPGTPGASGNAPGGVIGQILHRIEERRRRRFDRAHGLDRGRR